MIIQSDVDVVLVLVFFYKQVRFWCCDAIRSTAVRRNRKSKINPVQM